MNKDYQLTKQDFEFVNLNEKIHDAKFETKPVGYMKDAWLRFKKNKASVVAALIILLIILYGIIFPWVSPYKLSDQRVAYSYMRPKNLALSELGIWDGTFEKRGTMVSYAETAGIGLGTLSTYGNEGQILTLDDLENVRFNPLGKVKDITYDFGIQYVNYKVDQYYQLGFYEKQVTKQEYAEMLAWQEESGIQIIYPLINKANLPDGKKDNANMWYMVDSKGYPLDADGKSIKELDKLTSLIPNYLTDSEGNYVYTENKGVSSYNIRVLRVAEYIYTYGEEPSFLLGADGQGYDIAVRLAYGIRLSLILAVCVATINLVIGTIYGAIEGYYGGTIDLIMERISDILGNIPSMVVITLFNIYFVETNKVSPAVSFILAFIATGWLGTAYRVRTQFYRFKGQEYVLAARTLGAKDARLMFKHIFPNSLGTIITSSILVIPGVIFSETSLSYLGIIDLNGPNATSLGTLLAAGQQKLESFPHVILWPAIIISLLMLSFNLFGNGLRDAFNPSLRGVDE